MNPRSSPPRILIVDDNPSIHEDFRRIFQPRPGGEDFDAEAAALLGTPMPEATTHFDVEFASQGPEALDLVVAACAAGRPFALAFVDMRMPPGWDGLVTIGKLWGADPALGVVICTAHSDRTWEEIEAALTARDRWLVVKKPFDKIEVLQVAHVLASRWTLARAAAAVAA
jgi:two-component system, NtrC family, sensor kinase